MAGSEQGIDPKTLREHFRDELNRGAPKANASVSQRLYQKCMDGDITAIIWWDKTRGGKVPAAAVVATVEERHTISAGSARERLLELVMNAIAADQVEAEVSNPARGASRVPRIIDVTPEPVEDPDDDADGVAS